MDFEHTGDLDLRFQVEIYKNDEKHEVLELDPTDKSISIFERKSTFGNRTQWSFKGKNNEVTIKANANYTFKVKLFASKYSSLIMNKADLVLKM